MSIKWIGLPAHLWSAVAARLFDQTTRGVDPVYGDYLEEKAVPGFRYYIRPSDFPARRSVPAAPSDCQAVENKQPTPDF